MALLCLLHVGSPYYTSTMGQLSDGLPALGKTLKIARSLRGRIRTQEA